MRDSDIWWHLRNAQIPLSTHHFIRQDTYSFTTFGQPWINPEWLAEIPYYLAFRLSAERAIFLVTLLAVDLIIAGVLLLSYRRSGHISAGWLATWIAVLLASINIGPPHHSLRLALFSRRDADPRTFRHGRDRLWLLVPLFALWINLHGSWLIGYAFLFYYFGISHIPPSTSLHAAEAKYFPAVALPDLNRACANQNVLNRYEWDGYLIWNAREIPVFLDSRTDISLNTAAYSSTT